MVESLRPRVVVFDFDGTLVDSNALKRRAWFQLFPDRDKQHAVVEDVLREIGEESRYVILSEILQRLGEKREARLQARVQCLAQRYNELALEGAASCREIPGASNILAQLSGRYSLYVSSGTPRESLEALITSRGWTAYFKNVFGYPCTKVQTLNHISDRESCDPGAILVAGDGDSDEMSATVTGCRFFPVRDDNALYSLARLLT